MSGPFGKCDCGNAGCCGDDDGCMANGIRDVAELPDRTSPDEMKDISIDLETLSTRHDAAVLSIGAVAFDRATGEIGDKLYVEVDVDDAIAHGHVSGSTLEWWVQQSEKARQLFGAQSKSFLAPALNQLSMFITQHRGAKVWGNGATFDITILEHAYTRLDLPVPWKYWDIRDMRTIVETATAMGFDKHSVPFEGTKHSAVDDAAHQARVIARSWTYCCARNAAGQAASCTCPSGDGSLRWPCPAHPPAEDRTAAADAGGRGAPSRWPVLKGIGKINGDGWKDTTRIGDVVFVWNDEKPAPYKPGQYPRIGNQCGWTASTDQYDFLPASAEETMAAIEGTLADRPAAGDAISLATGRTAPLLPVGTLAWALMTPTGTIRYWSQSHQAVAERHVQCPNETLVPIIGAAADMERRALTAEAVLGELERSNPHAVMNARATVAAPGTDYPLTPQGQIDHG